ncbi:MAG TPA: AbrB/MazE/SpoVT family DNA-binding domain-containing protein [Thermomicrobiales bacterium]|nr:AbrB/MazE/SpoVT family DNA-binding domain-containing protein [Thermomicrobiales bacterium]
MAPRVINVRTKGQMTLPADICEELGLRDGGALYLKRREHEIVLIPVDAVVDPTDGILAEYAYTRNPSPAEEREWVARHIAKSADDYE